MQQTISHSIKQEIRETLSVGIPLIAAQMIYACSGFIGTAFIAKLGQDALAASVLVSTIWMTLSVLFFGILNSVSVLVAHQYGAKNIKAISEIMGQSFILGIMVTIVMILVLLTLPLFLHMSTQPQHVLQLAYQYMYSFLWTVPALVFLIIMEQFLAGVNRTKMVLRISLFVVPIEIPLIYILVFGKLGLPAFGIAGVGYGFAITYTFTAIFLFLYLGKSPQFKKFHIFNGINQFRLHIQKEFINVGFPMGFMHVIELSTFTLITFWIARFGTTMLAAHQIVLQFLSFAITLVFAVSQAVTVRVGHSVGKQDLQGIYYASYIGIFLNLICVILIAIAFYFVPQFFLQLDINIHDKANAQLLHDASLLLGIGGISMIFDNFRIVGFGALRGLKDTRYPLYSAFIGFWLVGLSCSYLLSFKFHLDGAGIWWGLGIGIFVGAIIVMARLQYLLQHIDVKKLASYDAYLR